MFDDEKERLFDMLQRIDRSRDTSWLDGLEARKREEARFHDEKVDRRGMLRTSAELPELKRGNKRFYSTVAKSKDYLNQWIQEHVPGKIVLDYACGQGALTREAARAGAKMAIGMDISHTSIENAHADAQEEGLSGETFFYQGDCENTCLPDASVDVILCSGMLHHLDVRRAFPEMYRILKPGGVCFALEALDYNPINKLYRVLTPSLRTSWEKRHILSHRDLRLARQQFIVRNVRHWHLFSLLATPLRRTKAFAAALAVGNAIDAVVLRLPLVSRLAWQFSFELHKVAVSGGDVAGSAIQLQKNIDNEQAAA